MANRKVLLVEGTDDLHVLRHICQNRNIPAPDSVEPLGGIPGLLEHIPVRLKASEEGDVVGVVVDADTDVKSRWQSIRHRTVDLGYPNVPSQPVPDGTILDPPEGTLLPRWGIWIMPDNRTPGILEDFLHFLIPQPNRLLDHVKGSIAGIPEDERLFGPLDEPKAVIHTWLAWQREPGKPFGTAITARFLDPNVSEADDLVAWLRRLFFP